MAMVPAGRRARGRVSAEPPYRSRLTPQERPPTDGADSCDSYLQTKLTPFELLNLAREYLVRFLLILDHTRHCLHVGMKCELLVSSIFHMVN